MADFDSYVAKAMEMLGNNRYVRYSYSLPENVRSKVHDGTYDGFREAVRHALWDYPWIITKDFVRDESSNFEGTVSFEFVNEDGLTYNTYPYSSKLQSMMAQLYPPSFSIDLSWDDESEITCTVIFTFEEEGTF